MTEFETCQVLLGVAGLFVGLFAVIGTFVAAYYALQTYRKQAQQVTVMEEELASARAAERDRIRAVSPSYGIALELPRAVGLDLDPKTEVLFGGPGGEFKGIKRILALDAKSVSFHLALSNALPFNIAHLIKAHLISGPKDASLGADPMPIRESFEGEPIRDTLLVRITAASSDFHAGNPIEFGLTFQTSGGHLVTQKFHYGLGGGELMRID